MLHFGRLLSSLSLERSIQLRHAILTLVIVVYCVVALKSLLTLHVLDEWHAAAVVGSLYAAIRVIKSRLLSQWPAQAVLVAYGRQLLVTERGLA